MTQRKRRPPVKSRARKKRGPQTAQQTIPYREMLKDGICKVREGYYTKSIEYEDINYAVASSDDQSTIFDGYCSFLNYFDAALPFQLSFINHRSRPESRYNVNIEPQEDEYDSISFDNSLPQRERAARILEQVKNPYCFRHGDTAVKIEFSDDGPPLQDVIANFLIRQKSGL